MKIAEITTDNGSLILEGLDYKHTGGQLTLASVLEQQQQGCVSEINSAGRVQYVCPPGQMPEAPAYEPSQVGSEPLPTPYPTPVPFAQNPAPAQEYAQPQRSDDLGILSGAEDSDLMCTGLGLFVIAIGGFVALSGSARRERAGK